MGTLGILIVFALLGSVICAKSRSAGGAVVFAGIALALFIATPVGAGLPGVLSDFVSAISQAAQPLTNGPKAAG
ncbi:MAG: hypothetical protein J0I49_33220 [Pseudonocardia sp.]|uniref:hypothetical protein n=1 Tax=Pseudonocardia sp. TaxID=60912 RepID=UPI001AD52857|nr:hypothetical protein [Pseudonocardia sp.]MBN9102919.1 hypothetical protein [Pseudonocardia sp.]